MRRVWLALLLALALPLAGFLVTTAIDQVCRPIALQLEQAKDADLAEAAQLCAAAHSSWEKSRKFVASVTDHEPLEEVDAAFRALQVYLDYGDTLHISQGCASLAAQVRAIGESQGVGWWSIL